MKRSVQILLLCALLPQIGSARAETMEERKRRIMRKYMCAPASSSESNMLVPVEELPEDEQILDSEKFKEPQVEFKPHEAGAMPMPRQVLRPLPKPEERNWLLAEDPLAEEDPYADPFSMEEEEPRPTRDYRDVQRTEPGRYDPYSWSKQEVADPRSPETEGYPRSRLFGTRPEERSASSFSLDYRRKTPSRVAPSSDLLKSKSPFSATTPSSERYRTDQKSQQGLIPYRSPYQTQQSPRTPYSSQPGFRQEPQEFKRVDPYQKWKEQRNTWDPTKDDAYINELMRRDRR